MLIAAAAAAFDCCSMTGVDIDQLLIDRARRNLAADAEQARRASVSFVRADIVHDELGVLARAEYDVISW
jgi:23S rRNA G2069 N7-methylase RlmK/C1962 C5-methylase RlmI